MNTDAHILLERITSLHKNLTRKVASLEGLPYVHVEIMQYLSICNRYSNTAQAVSGYLGQTKGSISQSIKIMEDEGFIRRKACKRDGRVIRLYLTGKSKVVLERIQKSVFIEDDDMNFVSVLENVIRNWQKQVKGKGFGQCQTCRYHLILDEEKFKCGLTNELLSIQDVQLLCQEHEFNKQ